MKLPKIDVKTILIAVLLGFIVFQQFFHSDPPIEPEEVVVVIPEVVGTAEEVIEEVPEVEVEVPSNTLPLIKETIVVDEEYKLKYENAIKEKDSVAAENLFLRSIQIKEYSKTVVDNDDIKIDASAKVRGALLDYKVDYKLKEKEVTYTPEVIRQRPKFTMITGLGLIVPTQPDSKPAVKFDLGFQNQRGNVIELGIDNNRNIYAGYKYAIKFRKKRK